MPNMNQCNFIGHLAKDPEIRAIPSGTHVCSFALAVNAGYGERKKTAFVDCTAWGKRAETLAQWCVKGDALRVTCEVIPNNWEDKDGKKHYHLKFNVSDFGFIKIKGKNNSDTDDFDDPGATPF